MTFNDILRKLFGNKSQRDMREIQPYVERIKQEYEKIKQLDNDSLRAKIDEVKAHIQEYVAEDKKEIADLKAEVETLPYEKRLAIWNRIDNTEKIILKKYEEVLDEVLPVVFAVVKDTARRFAENPETVVTANDFDRDLAATHDFVRIEGDKAIYLNHWMAGGNEITWDMVHYDVQLFGGVVLHKGKIAEMATGEGKTLVATLPVFLNALPGNGVHVITFGTNNEFGFDYLRDNMAISPSDLVQRMHNYAIVDEVDSVLIDDARTPLIISGPIPKGEDQMFEEFCPKVEELYKAQRALATQLLSEAKRKIASANKDERREGALLLYRCFKGLPKNTPLIKYLSEPGIKSLMLETEEFYMQDNNRQMHIVTDPLYFVIDEKNNGVDLTDKGLDIISKNMDDPDFFVLPDIGAQLAELENENLSPEEKQEKKDALLQNYAIKQERTHTVHQLLKAYTLFNRDEEYVVIDNKVKIVDEQTGRIMEGRRYSDGLHQAIEAKERVKVEAATQTFATITLQNYFRMYHKLAGMTGTAETEAGEFWDIYKLDVVTIPTNKPVIREDMNDRVYKTKREKYNAVIEEVERLVNAGRPVLVGTTSVEISELLSKMLKLRKIEHNVLNAKLHQREAEIVAQAGQRGIVTIATNMAGRGTDIKLSDSVREAGGLAIIGTERHESRRVDRQLRGRSGRQGDPGSSVFFVSLEDNLMRLFSSERIAKVMDRLGFKEGEMIEHSMVSRSIEKAQRKVEENNFGIRKRLLEYDDVMNSQRELIYSKRHHALMGERIGIDIMDMMFDCVSSMVETYAPEYDYEGLKEDVMRTFSVEMPFGEDSLRNEKRQALADKLYEAVTEAFNRKSEALAATAYPVIKQVYEEQGDRYDNILVPVTDGKRFYNITCNLKEAYESHAKSINKAFQKTVLLYTIDEAWKEHLRDLDQLRQSVQAASYEQKDPLLIFKIESFGLFRDMLDTTNRKSIAILMRGRIPVREPQQVREAVPEKRQDFSRYKTQKDTLSEQREGATASGGSETSSQNRTPVKAGPKIGRNDPCPCGSGKKYKNCHGRNEQA